MHESVHRPLIIIFSFSPHPPDSILIGVSGQGPWIRMNVDQVPKEHHARDWIRPGPILTVNTTCREPGTCRRFLPARPPPIPYQMQIFLWDRLSDTGVTSATWRAAKPMTTGTSTTADRAHQSTVLSPFFRAFPFHSLDPFVTVTLPCTAVRGENQSASKTVTCLCFLRA